MSRAALGQRRVRCGRVRGDAGVLPAGVLADGRARVAGRARRALPRRRRRLRQPRTRIVPGLDCGRPPSAQSADFLIVANAGACSRATLPYGGLRGLLRAKDVGYRPDDGKLRVRWYVRELLAARQRGIYLAIELDPRQYRLPDATPIDPTLYDGALPSDLVPELTKLRTGFDRFAPEEANLLSSMAYWSTHARLGALHPDSPSPTQLGVSRVAYGFSEIADFRRHLVRGSRRLRLPGTWHLA